MKIVIRTFDRADSIQKKTLAELMKVYDEKFEIHLVLANKDEQIKYKTVIDTYPIKDVIISGLGANVARNAAIDYFPDGEPLVFMDDDISNMQMLKHSGLPKEIIPLDFIGVFDYAFSKMNEQNVSALSVNFASNMLFKQNSPFLEMKPYKITCAFNAMFNDKQSKALIGHGDDNVITSYFLEKDKKIANLNWLLANINYGTLKGGMQSSGCRDDSDNRLNHTLSVCKRLLEDPIISKYYKDEPNFNEKANCYDLQIKPKLQLKKVMRYESIKYSTYLQNAPDGAESNFF
jgi:hypothetical protein